MESKVNLTVRDNMTTTNFFQVHYKFPNHFKSKVNLTARDNMITTNFFEVHYKFPNHFNILCDLYILRHLAGNKINVKEALYEIFKSKLGLFGTGKSTPEEAWVEIYEKKLRLYTTECVMQKFKREPIYEMLDESNFTKLPCKNKDKLHDRDACIEKVIGSKNEGKFYFATMAEHDLYSKMRKKPAVPVIVGMGGGLVLKTCSDRQIQLALAFKGTIPVEEGSPLEEINEVILFYKTYFGIKFPPQVLMDGPSLRYIASNGFSLGDVAKVVGTNRNSMQTTSCIIEELKKAGNEDMEGAMALAIGLMVARCGHGEIVAGRVCYESGSVCYESLLRKGEHIGLSCESSNNDLSEKMAMMEGVPFIVAKDRVLSLMPPSEALIMSKDMPDSERKLLLDLAKSHSGKDQNSENERISRNDRARKRNSQNNEVGHSFGKKSKHQTQ